MDQHLFGDPKTDETVRNAANKHQSMRTGAANSESRKLRNSCSVYADCNGSRLVKIESPDDLRMP
jgi:hypothetical protein